MKPPVDDKKLKNFIRTLKKPMGKVQIGILGDKNSRKEGANGNAEIGAVHEFGSIARGIPKRSFLRMPLETKFKSALSNLPVDKNGVLEIIKEQSAIVLLMKLGALGKAIILNAFDTRGFGNWKPSNMKYKKVKQTLVESQQLRNSINFRIKEATASKK
jgi:hypothetical protein